MIHLKRGDTFSLAAVVQGDGVAADITGWTIASQIRTASGTLIDTLTVAVTSAVAGTYTLDESAAGVTEAWPVGKLEMDIQYTVGGVIVSTETAQIRVERDVTR